MVLVCLGFSIIGFELDVAEAKWQPHFAETGTGVKIGVAVREVYIAMGCDCQWLILKTLIMLFKILHGISACIDDLKDCQSKKPFNVRLNETKYLMMLLIIFMTSFLRTCSWCIVKSATRRLEEKHRVDNQHCIRLLLLLQFLSISLYHYSLQDWCHVHAGDGT